MLGWIIGLAVVALIAGALGFGGVASVAAGAAKFLFFGLLIVIAVLLILLRFEEAPPTFRRTAKRRPGWAPQPAT